MENLHRHDSGNVWGGKWDQFIGKVKSEWGQMTDNDLKVAEGNLQMLIGKISEKTGEAAEDIQQRLNELREKLEDR